MKEWRFMGWLRWNFILSIYYSAPQQDLNFVESLHILALSPTFDQQSASNPLHVVNSIRLHLPDWPEIFLRFLHTSPFQPIHFYYILHQGITSHFHQFTWECPLEGRNVVKLCNKLYIFLLLSFCILSFPIL